MPQQEVAPARLVEPRKSRSWLAWSIVLVLIAVAAAIWWQRPQPGNEASNERRGSAPASVGAATVGSGDIDVKLDALGTVTSLATVTVKSQISGQLVEVDFTEGQEVKKGDLLARIDSRPYEAALAQAQGQLVRDQALLNGAQVDLKRYQVLSAQNAVPRQTLDTQVALVAQYAGTIEADKAAIQAAQVNLDYCRILAPNDGRVGLRQVDAGNYVTSGDANGIVVITQIEPISVLFTLPEDQLQAVSRRLQKGAALPVSAFDRTGRNKLDDGTLETFDSQIDPTTGTIKLRGSFANDSRNLFPNQFVNIELLLDRHENVTIMPNAAVQRGVPGTFVYLIDGDQTVSVRKIELGVVDADRVEVVSGLAPGDRVVVDGADKLRDGAKINVRTDDQAPAQPSGSAPPRAAGTHGKKQMSEAEPRQ